MTELRNRAVLEARCLTAFVYYELSSLATMFEQLGISLGGELRYAVKARNLFIAHPQVRGALRNSTGALEVRDSGLHTYAINSAESDPRMIAVYLKRPFAADLFDQYESALQENRELLVRVKRLRELSDDQLARMRVFGVPEPDFDIIQKELVEVLRARVLPKIERVSKRAIVVGR